jgi:hypothetical protein
MTSLEGWQEKLINVVDTETYNACSSTLAVKLEILIKSPTPITSSHSWTHHLPRPYRKI